MYITFLHSLEAFLKLCETDFWFFSYCFICFKELIFLKVLEKFVHALIYEYAYGIAFISFFWASLYCFQGIFLLLNAGFWLGILSYLFLLFQFNIKNLFELVFEIKLLMCSQSCLKLFNIGITLWIPTYSWWLFVQNMIFHVLIVFMWD
jgi:hypothetical protein